jgi:hypothetical protein
MGPVHAGQTRGQPKESNICSRGAAHLGRALSAHRAAARVAAAQAEAPAAFARGRPGDDGMATLSAVLPAPVARAVQDALRRYAEPTVTEGGERTLTHHGDVSNGPSPGLSSPVLREKLLIIGG